MVLMFSVVANVTIRLSPELSVPAFTTLLNVCVTAPVTLSVTVTGLAEKSSRLGEKFLKLTATVSALE